MQLVLQSIFSFSGFFSRFELSSATLWSSSICSVAPPNQCSACRPTQLPNRYYFSAPSHLWVAGREPYGVDRGLSTVGLMSPRPCSGDGDGGGGRDKEPTMRELPGNVLAAQTRPVS